MHNDLPLFAWKPPCKVIFFPMVRRIGRIRDVAKKMLVKPTERAASSYRHQVTEALLRTMESAGVPETEQDEQLGAFWTAVQSEMIQMTHQGRRPGG